MTTNESILISNDSINEEDPSPSSPTTLATSSPNAAIKKARRQTAFYPNVNSSNKTSKPFSRSAAKRESVMALGSIEHLQYYFTKAGIAAKEKPHSNSIIVPAIGGPQYIETSPSGEITKILEDDANFVLPPSPIHPPSHHQSFPRFLKTYETDPEQLKPGVVEDLKAVSDAWRFSLESISDEECSTMVDVLSLLRLTTRVIRSVRNYVVSLPDESIFPVRSPPQFRPSTLRPQIPPRSSTPSPSSSAHSASPSSLSDALYRIRRVALEVLSALHSLEETARLPLSDEAYDAQSDHGSTSSRSLTASHERISSSSPLSDEDLDSNVSFTFSVVKVPGRSEHIRVWSDEDDELLLDSDDGDATGKGKWDEKLVLGSGWLYRQDITFGMVLKEREIVGRYLDAVDEALFDGLADGKRGWERVKVKVDSKRRRSSGEGSNDVFIVPPSNGGSRRASSPGLLGAVERMRVEDERPQLSVNVGLGLSGLHDVHEEDEEEEDTTSGDGEVPDSELPDWANRSSKFNSDPLARAHALLVNLLPAALLHVLPLPVDLPSPITPTPLSNAIIPRLPFLQALTSGQLLCVAYNGAVRRSRKPWGFISLDSVHDVIGMEANTDKDKENHEDDEDETSGRKVGWTFRRIDNLRLWIAALRLRYMMPIVSPNSLAQPKLAADQSPVLFDPRTVARLDPGWDTMLEAAIFRWVEEVVKEKRGG